MISKIDGRLFKEMLITANHLLQKYKSEIDALNVFPVPDGDTGTNMSLTFKAAIDEMIKNNTSDIEKLASQAAMGALIGARGNSGVILSQLIRGIAKKIEGKKELTINDLAECFNHGAETAYKAVMKPVEGTILTVAKEAALATNKGKFSDIESLLQETYNAGNLALERTPEQLPVLKQAGVVDAGGKGWLVILEGFLLAVQGKGIKEEEFNSLIEIVAQENIKEDNSIEVLNKEISNIEFRYCTEFIIKGQNISELALKDKLASLGDCLLVVGTPDIMKVHIHSNNPGRVLEIAVGYGVLNKIKIDNMEEQHNEKLVIEAQVEDKVVEFKKIGTVAVAMGEGIGEIFKSLGVDEVIYGGQTMNPSTGDIIDAVNKIKVEEVIILPNNSNIILTAQQAEYHGDKKIKVVGSKSIPEGIAAMMGFNPETSIEENYENMIEMIDGIITGEITYAVRDSQYEDWRIKNGDILGLIGGKINLVGTTPEKVLIDLIKNNINDKKLVTIYYGNEVHEEVAHSIIIELQENLPTVEFELYSGNQPLYYYIFSIE